MFRALLELIVTIIVAIAARAILGSLFRGFAGAARSGYQQPSEESQPRSRQSAPRENIRVAGELHKDPVCGTYVAESTRFQRKNGNEIFYYCSEQCKDKHAVAAR